MVHNVEVGPNIDEFVEDFVGKSIYLFFLERFPLAVLRRKAQRLQLEVIYPRAYNVKKWQR